jgi:hypothetical protein
MKAQMGNGVSGIHLCFYLHHNCDGRFVKCTRVPHFTPLEIPYESLLLEDGCTL